MFCSAPARKWAGSEPFADPSGEKYATTTAAPTVDVSSAARPLQTFTAVPY